MKKIVLLFILNHSIAAFSQLPVPNGGSIRHFENFSSHFIAARNIDVWLPDGYSVQKKYPVLYMHDGQMLFDSAHNWNHQEWQVDETISRLAKENKIRECIVVGIWNNYEYRHSDYFPQKPLEYLPTQLRKKLIKEELKGKPGADNYLLFLTKEVKPFIDKTFSTLKNRQNTFIAGSSMGGLISLYAICEYPKLFGGAACLSTHWIGSILQEKGFIPNAFIQYLTSHLPSPRTHKIYFDHGTVTLDSLYKPWQLMVDEVMKERGFNPENWMTTEFPSEEHTEKAWAKRLYIPLQFLLSKIAKGGR